RAHIMVKRLQQRGFKPRKVWAFANGGMLYARTRNSPSGSVQWLYHVAPLLRVRQSDGRQVWLVIDPSMFNAPVGIEQWKNAKKRPGGLSPHVTVTRI